MDAVIGSLYAIRYLETLTFQYVKLKIGIILVRANITEIGQLLLQLEEINFRVLVPGDIMGVTMLYYRIYKEEILNYVYPISKE